MDTYTEERILGGLRNYTSTATTILISHRVSTVRNADRIAVLDRGRIVELGGHDELLALEIELPGIPRFRVDRPDEPGYPETRPSPLA